jgi:membrane-associated protease RseP (regulator of RpoE activity)
MEAMLLVMSMSLHTGIWNVAVPQGSIGVVTKDISVLMVRQMKMRNIIPPKNGLYVTKVISNSPAAKSGIRAGDVIISINGVAATNRTIEQLVVGQSYSIGIAKSDIAYSNTYSTPVVRTPEGWTSPTTTVHTYAYHPSSFVRTVKAVYCENKHIK